MFNEEMFLGLELEEKVTVCFTDGFVKEFSPEEFSKLTLNMNLVTWLAISKGGDNE